MSFIDSGTFRKAYLGKHAENLMLKSMAQALDVYVQRGIAIPVVTSSTLQFLSKHEGASLADISRGLNLPHQLVAQRIDKLLKLNLIEKRSDPTDGRRSEYHLNDAGKGQAKRLITCMEDTADIYTDLFDEIGCDLAQALMDAVSALNRKSLKLRFYEKYEERKAN